MVKVRRLDGGDWCVDADSVWFRVRASGEVETRMVVRRANDPIGSVKSRPATEREIKFAKTKIADYQLNGD